MDELTQETTATGPRLSVREPTGERPWPFIYVESDAKAGKRRWVLPITGSARTGQAYYLDLGEGTADEYATLDGAEYLVLVHDGTFVGILEQVQAVHAEAARVAAEDGPPVVLIVDSLSGLWRMFTRWTSSRARRSHKAQARLRADADASIEIPPNLWVETNERWDEVISLLRSMRGIVVALGRGRFVDVIDEPGEDDDESAPTRRNVWRGDVQRSVTHDARAWLRLYRGSAAPRLMGGRSLPVATPAAMPGLTLEALVFDIMKCTAAPPPATLKALSGDQAQVWTRRLEAAGTQAELQAVYDEARSDPAMPPAAWRVVMAIVERRVAELSAPPGAEDPDAPGGAELSNPAIEALRRAHAALSADRD